MNKNLKRWLISSLVSFLSGFSAVMLLNFESITLQSLSDGSLVGLLFLAVRSGIKGILELLVKNK